MDSVIRALETDSHEFMIANFENIHEDTIDN